MSTTIQTSTKSSKAVNVILWILQILTALAFLMAGLVKFSGNPMMVEAFAKIGVGQWFRYVTGAIEVSSAIMLLIPKLIPVGALLLICTMVGAIIALLTVLGGSPVAAIVLLLLSMVILWGRRERLAALTGSR
jgi:putative oxidoreductase